MQISLKNFAQFLKQTLGKIMDEQCMNTNEQRNKNTIKKVDVHYDMYGVKWEFLKAVKSIEDYKKLCYQMGVSIINSTGRLYRSRPCLKRSKIGCDYRLLLVKPTQKCSKFLGNVYFRGKHKHSNDSSSSNKFIL